MLLNPIKRIAADPTNFSHRYWRVRGIINQHVGNSASGKARAFSAAEIEFRATPGGANQATGGTPSARTTFSGSYPVSNAFDGNGSTFWVSNNDTANYGLEWIAYDFGSPVFVREISWAKRPDSFGANEGIILGVVQYSDNNSDWSSSWAFVTTPNWSTGAETRVFTKPTNALLRQFWRVRVTALQSGPTAIPSFAEVQFRETAGGANVATGGQGIASRTAGYAPINNAFDGNNTTFWNADQAVSATPWIGYAFSDEKHINEIALRNRNDSFGDDQGITAGEVESSVDGLTWESEWSFTSPATWLPSAAETRVFTRP